MLLLENIPDDSSEILKLPPSSTGMRGVISGRTLSLTQDIRKKGVKMILVSGMRASTLFSRLPYLPRADAYAVEVRSALRSLGFIFVDVTYIDRLKGWRTDLLSIK